MEDITQIDTQEEMLTSKYGHKLFVRVWRKKNVNIRSLIYICHGLGEHSNCYNEIALKLIDKEYLVFAHDHVGHGKSEGTRVDISSFNIYVDDVIQNVADFKSKHLNIPCFILGHSMGGTISILAAYKIPSLFNGVILISPAIIEDKETATSFKIFLANVASYIIPQAQIVGKLESKWLSRDPKVCEEYDKDPLVWHGGIKSRQAMCLLGAMQDIQKLVPNIDFPFLICHGTHDKLCHIDGSKLMHDKSKSTDKSLKIYDGCYHQIHKESDGIAEDCLQLIISWIQNHL